MAKSIIVERELFEYKGKEYYSYFIKGTVKGRDVRVGIKPPDNGGYIVLDIFFDSGKPVNLVVNPYEITTEDGSVLTGNTYAVEGVDEDTGEVYSCKVKPARESDKTLLAMLLNQAA